MIHFLLNVIKVAFLLGFLILIHEGGHFIVAKLFKIKVKEFSLGFGPVIWKKQWKETKYELRAIPLGGFVNLLGEEEEVNEEGSYSMASRWKKILVLLAGGTVNIIFGLLAYFLLITISGNFVSTTIDKTVDNYAAQIAGLQSEDKIIKIDNKKIRLKSDIDEAVEKSNGKEISLTIERNKEIIEIKITPTKEKDSQEILQRYYLGIIFKLSDNSLENRLYYGFWNTIGFSGSIAQNVKELFTGNVRVEELTGPVGISEVVVQTQSTDQFIYILALVSLSLGVTNLLPFPPLDGGKVLLLIIEAVIKKPIKENVSNAIQMTGFFIIMGLAVIVTYHDVLRIF